MKKQLLTLCAAAVAVFAVAQQPTTDAATITSDVVIDGSLTENAWLDATAVAIDQPFQSEVPSVTAEFKILWSTQGLFVGVDVVDDVWAPSWVTGKADWESDKIEVYYDLSDPQIDGLGASGEMGNYQIGMNFQETTQGEGVYHTNGGDGDTSMCYASTTFDAAGAYQAEYFVPASELYTAGMVDGSLLTLADGTVIGFDVTICDNDDDGVGRKRAVWANIGGTDESWNNMDDVGLVTLKGTGAEVAVDFNLPISSTAKTSVNNTMVYPNVASEMIYVNAEAAEYSIINSLGQVVMVSETNEINISALETGVYFVKANDQVARILKK